MASSKGYLDFMKLLTIAIPSYNSEDYLSHAVESLLPGRLGRAAMVSGYKISQKIFGFN